MNNTTKYTATAIFNFISGTMNMRPSEMISSWQPDENELYEGRQKVLNNLWKDAGLSSGEMEFWQERENQIEKPFIYQEHGGYEELFLSFQTVGFLVLMLIAIALSGIFFDEHTKRTDQLIYRGKSDPVSCGQAILIAYGNILMTAIIVSAFVMIISELLHSNIAALAVSAVLLMASMIVTVPEQYRVLVQIWNWLPCSFLAPWNVFGEYTLPVFGCHFTPWQAVPVIYLVVSVIIILVGKPLYQRFQVSGR